MDERLPQLIPPAKLSEVPDQFDEETDPKETFDQRKETLVSLGFPEEVIEAIQSVRPTLPPSKDVIARVTLMRRLQLQAIEIVDANPTVIELTPEIIQDKFDNLTTLGIDAAIAINKCPDILTYAIESVKEKVENLTKLGIAAAKAVNDYPKILSHSIESVQRKVENITRLGIDADEIIRGYPNVIGYSPEVVASKIDYINQVVGLLGWNYQGKDLIETFPNILSFSQKRLSVLARIAMILGNENDQNLTPKEVRSALINPLERYIISLGELSDDQPKDLRALVALAKKRNGMSQVQRQKEAQSAVTHKQQFTEQPLSTVGRLYHRYTRGRRGKKDTAA